MKTTFLSISIGLFLLACSSAKLLIPSQSDADRAAKVNSDITLASLNEGKTLFEQNCNKCHGYKSPPSKSEEKWNKIIPRMVAKVNKKTKKETINPEQQNLILNYVITMSAVKPVK